MTVGRWPGEWLVFDADGRPDKFQTVGTLWRAQRIGVEPTLVSPAAKFVMQGPSERSCRGQNGRRGSRGSRSTASQAA